MLAQAGSGSGGKHERISRKGECNNRRRISGSDGPYTLSRSASRPLIPSITTFVIHPHPPLHVTTTSRFTGRGQATPVPYFGMHEVYRTGYGRGLPPPW